MSRSEDFHEGADSIPLHETRCTFCGDPIRYNGFLRKGVPKAQGGGTIEVPNPRAGWGHSDGMRREGHNADPVDSRTPDADMERQRRGFNAARMQMKRHFQRRFDEVNAQQTVDEIAKEMGL